MQGATLAALPHFALPLAPSGACLDRWVLEATAAAVAPAGTTLTWVDPAFAAERGVTPANLPLWHGPDLEWLGAVDPAAATARGFAPRDLADTARDTLDAAATTPLDDGVGPAADREAELLAAWHAAGG